MVDKRGDLVLGDIQRDVLQRMEFAVVEVQIAYLNFAAGSVSNHTHQDFSLFISAAKAALKILRMLFLGENYARQDIQ